MNINVNEGQIGLIRRPYVRPVLIERGLVTELTLATNGNSGPEDGGGFPNYYS